MFARTFVSMVAAAVMSLGWAGARADEPAKSPPSPKAGAAAAPAASPAEIAGWVQQLDADEYAEREAAQEKLIAAGKAAMPDLTKAAIHGSLEAATRSVEVLKTFYGSADQATKKAAKESLETIAKSPKAAVARRAAQIIQLPPKPGDPNNAGGLQIGGGGLHMQGPGIQLHFGIAGGGGGLQIAPAGPAGPVPSAGTPALDRAGTLRNQIKAALNRMEGQRLGPAQVGATRSPEQAKELKDLLRKEAKPVRQQLAELGKLLGRQGSAADRKELKTLQQRLAKIEKSLGPGNPKE